MITATQVYEAEFRRAGAGTPGYDEIVVDDYLDRVIATLTALERGERAPSDAVTSQDVVEVEFPERSATVGGGYDMDDVDDLLDLVAQRLYAAQQAGGDARRDVAGDVDGSPEGEGRDDVAGRDAGLSAAGVRDTDVREGDARDDGGAADARALAVASGAPTNDVGRDEADESSLGEASVVGVPMGEGSQDSAPHVEPVRDEVVRDENSRGETGRDEAFGAGTDHGDAGRGAVTHGGLTREPELAESGTGVDGGSGDARTEMNEFAATSSAIQGGSSAYDARDDRGLAGAGAHVVAGEGAYEGVERDAAEPREAFAGQSRGAVDGESGDSVAAFGADERVADERVSEDYRARGAVEVDADKREAEHAADESFAVEPFADRRAVDGRGAAHSDEAAISDVPAHETPVGGVNPVGAEPLDEEAEARPELPVVGDEPVHAVGSDLLDEDAPSSQTREAGTPSAAAVDHAAVGSEASGSSGAAALDGDAVDRRDDAAETGGQTPEFAAAGEVTPEQTEFDRSESEPAAFGQAASEQGTSVQALAPVDPAEARSTITDHDHDRLDAERGAGAESRTMGQSWGDGVSAEPELVPQPSEPAREDLGRDASDSSLAGLGAADSSEGASTDTSVAQSDSAPSEQLEGGVRSAAEEFDASRPTSVSGGVPVVSYPATDHRVPLPRGDVRRSMTDADREAEAQYHPEYSAYTTPEGAQAEQEFDPFADEVSPSAPTSEAAQGFDNERSGGVASTASPAGLHNSPLSDRHGDAAPIDSSFEANSSGPRSDASFGGEPSVSAEQPFGAEVTESGTHQPFERDEDFASAEVPQRVAPHNDEVARERAPRDPMFAGNPPAPVAEELAARDEERQAARERLSDGADSVLDQAGASTSSGNTESEQNGGYGIGRPEPIDAPQPLDAITRPEGIEAPKALPARDDTSRKGILRRIFKG